MDLPGNGQADVLLGRAQAAGEQARLRALEQKRTPHTREDLARTAREFEGVFLDILMRAMRSTVPQNDLMGSGGATQIYRQMHDTEMARAMASSGGGLGIAHLLESQFADQFAADEVEPGESGVGLSGGELSGLGTDDGTGASTAGLPSPLALARYRHAAPSPPAPAIRVQDLGELPLAAPAAPPPAAAGDAVVAGPAAQAGEPARTRRDVEDLQERPERRERRDLVPVDRRLVAAPLQSAEADTVRRFGPAIDSAAATAGLDPRLVLAVVMEESGGDPQAGSRAGARGLMQLMPGTARELGVADRTDPAANLRGGARYLAQQLERFDGRLDLALAAYNAGPGNVARAGGRVPAFAETRGYVARVLGRYDRLRAGTELDTGQR